jgi:adenylate cyclase class 2
MQNRLVRPEFLQKRKTFYIPGNDYEKTGAWARVRDEGDKITLSYKVIKGNKIEGQKEATVVVDNFDKAVSILENIGCRVKSYQETKRELWMLDGVEITIDEWPFLEPLVEIEGKTEKDVKKASEKLGFDYKNAFFGCVSTNYSKKYGPDEYFINNNIPKIVFDMKNPFIKAKSK